MSASSKISTVFPAFLQVVAMVAATSQASAQMVLPGAVTPTPAGTTVSPEAHPGAPAKKRAKAGEGRPAPVAPAAKVPAPSTLAGQTLYLNGRRSQITFELRDKTVAASRLLLFGQRISKPQDECQVDAPGMPVATTDLGKPNGLSRIKLSFQACPIAFDVLDGAALAVGDPPACDFTEADCHVMPDGLWGPQAGAIGPDKVKGIEHARAQADLAVRTDFKLLLGTTKDRPTIMGYAREQAGFSSAREEICRDYAGEGRHGFCGTRLTEARAAALRAKFEVEAAAKALRKKLRAGK